MPKILLAALLALLAYGFWLSPDFREIAAGIALFLLGMISLEKGFKVFSGGILETALRRATDRLWKSIGFGIVSTTLMQSSTLVSLVTISFVSTGMIPLASGIAIVMGANLGTTTGAWLIAGFGLRVDLAGYALPFLVFGVILLFLRDRGLRGGGHLLLGIGFLFLGIHYMKEGFDALQGALDLTVLAIPGIVGVLLFTAVGMAITIVMQSSHATLLVIIAALAGGQVTYDSALALAIGANLGSAVTTALGGMAANPSGRRLAVAHVLFNVVTAAVAILLIPQMIRVVDALAGVIGIAADDHLLKLALFHTLFNLLGVLLFLPVIRLLETALLRYLRFAEGAADSPRYLFPEALGTPESAIRALDRELGHLYDNTQDVIALTLNLRRKLIASDASLLEAARQTRRFPSIDVDELYTRRIKNLYSSIIGFLAELQQQELPERNTRRVLLIQEASRDLAEAVKDLKHLHPNLYRLASSPYPPVRHHYDALRVQIARLLRDISELRAEEPGAVPQLSLDAISLALESGSRQRLEEINRMTRKREISAHVATSLMNDESYTREIGRKLLAAARVLLGSSDIIEQRTARTLALDEGELRHLADAESVQASGTGTPSGKRMDAGG